MDTFRAPQDLVRSFLPDRYNGTIGLYCCCRGGAPRYPAAGGDDGGDGGPGRPVVACIQTYQVVATRGGRAAAGAGGGREVGVVCGGVVRGAALPGRVLTSSHEGVLSLGTCAMCSHHPPAAGLWESV